MLSEYSLDAPEFLPQEFDFALTVLPQLASARGSKDNDKEKDKDKDSKDILQKPTRVLFVRFALSFLATRDKQLIRVAFSKCVCAYECA
jgi:hypothetical protein